MNRRVLRILIQCQLFEFIEESDTICGGNV